MKEPVVIAVCGKGGVGKTSISSMITKLLVEEKKDARILAIDADPAIGLATALGINPDKTINDIRNDVIEVAKNGAKEDKMTILSNLDYKVFDAMVEQNGFAFLAIGRPESEGCYCKVNTYLRSIISELVGKFDYVIIDGEAGIEQINRRVMEKVTHLLLVSDSSYKGINVIKTIEKVSDELIIAHHVGAVVNRVSHPETLNLLNLENINLLGIIEEDQQINICDIKGEAIMGLPNTKAQDSLKNILINFQVIKEDSICRN